MTGNAPIDGRLVLASNNAGKLAELDALLQPLGFALVSQAQLAIAGAPETADTFLENALAKARHAARASGLPALADDSGLCVDALGGAPGVRSARYAGADANDRANNEKLLATLAGQDNRAAHFHCTVVLLRHAADPAPLVAQGNWHGRILTAARGDNGFGYDPLFWVASESASSAQLPAQRKNSVSHRAQALQALATMLRSQGI
ncbi:MAG: RdgB/HAM1 family non-canonical purine NTP pyrophosphatase [Salinisphaera sp.]|nr:RdgB/HAM1 family non-canonical purine NTP pyrophosphatase [Salinisphaera sp.]